MNCDEVRRTIDPWVDGELAEPELEAVEGHLARCATCARRARFEVNFNRLLRERLAGGTAPPAVILRLRRHLDRDAGRVTGRLRGLVSSPVTGYAVAAALLLILLVPPLTGWAPALNAWRLPAGSQHASVVGMLVCIDCDLAHMTPAQQAHCRDLRHRGGVRRDDGSYWGVLNHGAGRELNARADLRGARVRVEGRTYPELDAVDVQAFDLI